MYEEDYDAGLCVGCEWCFYGSPKDCPQCKIIPEEDGDDIGAARAGGEEARPCGAGVAKIGRIRLALRGLETGCHRCDMRWKNISSLADTLEAEKKAGFESVDIDRVEGMIKSLY